MAENVKIKKKELKQSIANINKEMESLAKEIEHLSGFLDTMMKGNDKGPLWNGAAAKKFYTKAVANLKNDIEDYTAAYNTLNKIAVAYENLGASDK